MATVVACTFNRGAYFAHKIVTREIFWLMNGFIEEGRQGCFVKIRCWLNDECVMLHVQEWISGVRECKVPF